MIHKYNIAELSLVDRPIESKVKSGFGAVIPQHEAGNSRRYFQTENRDYFGDATKLTATEANNVYKKMTSNLAGSNLRAEDEQRNRRIANLVGENYDHKLDPQCQTDVQRSWLYQQDPAVRAVNEGNQDMKQNNMFDIATSLPMGDGVHKTLEFNGSMGAYAKKGTDVTKGFRN